MPSFFKAINADVTNNIRIFNKLSPQITSRSLQDLNQLNQININVLEYNALKSCIPKSWKRKFLENQSAADVKPIEPTIQINNTKKVISLITSKELYNTLILQNNENPNSN